MDGSYRIQGALFSNIAGDVSVDRPTAVDLFTIPRFVSHSAAFGDMALSFPTERAASARESANEGGCEIGAIKRGFLVLFYSFFIYKEPRGSFPVFESFAELAAKASFLWDF